MSTPRVLVVDNGSLSIPQLCRAFEKLGTRPEPLAVADIADRLDSRYQALVLSGTKVRAYDGDFYRRLRTLVLESSVPVWGICGGMQIIGRSAGATLVPGRSRVGTHKAQVDTSQPVFAGVGPVVSVFQRHTLYLRQAPPGFRTIGWSDDCPVEFIRSDDGRIYGSQAHLEFRADGLAILRGFVRLFS